MSLQKALWPLIGPVRVNQTIAVFRFEILGLKPIIFSFVWTQVSKLQSLCFSSAQQFAIADSTASRLIMSRRIISYHINEGIFPYLAFNYSVLNKQNRSAISKINWKQNKNSEKVSQLLYLNDCRIIKVSSRYFFLIKRKKDSHLSWLSCS